MKIEGIILYSQPFFEKDKRVELFDIAGGRVTLLAKSACVSIKRFGGRLEPTTYIQGAVTRKPGLSQLTDCTVIEAFPNLRTD
ncbi:hypothetical protein EBR96_02430, partial [bacterium]|nr:hypothetical protein [bacterium]